MRIIFAVLFLTTLAPSCWAQQAYKIDFKIKGVKDSTYYLGYYYGETMHIRDTTNVDKQGILSFSDVKKLPQGVYFLVLNNRILFELVIGNDLQHFTLETSSEDYIKNMKVTGDDDNRIFFENMQYIREKHVEADGFVKTLQNSAFSEDQKKDAKEGFSKITDKVLAYQNGLAEKYPGSLTVRIINVTKNISVPDPPKNTDGTVDTLFQLKYYRQHYFDYFNLADDAMIRMPKPFYLDKINDYLDRLYSQNADSLIVAIDAIAAIAKKNQETYKYLVWSCLTKYQRSNIMGLDAVYVYLADKYYLSGEMDFWATESIKTAIKSSVDKLRGSLIGKTGPNLIMLDQNLQRKSMYDIRKKYTILFIFDPKCPHCIEQTPKLVAFYNKDKEKFNLDVFAVSADTSMMNMRNFIRDMKLTWTTVNGPRSYVGPYGNLYHAENNPALYILDEKKKIIAKNIPAEKIEEFLLAYEKYRLRKAVN